MLQGKSLLLFAFSFFLFLPAWSSSPLSSPLPLSEGFDRQSLEEITRAQNEIQALFKDAILPESLSQNEKLESLRKYDHLDPFHQVPTDLLEEAVVYFDKNKKKFPNQAYLVVIDFRPRSDKYRFFLVDLNSGEVEKYHTTHGTGSDRDADGIAERFLNVVGSNASSLGFARTAETYYGQFQRSLRLDGLSTTNSKLRERAVVIHGWGGAHEANVIQSLSLGCPALDWSVKDQIIDKIKQGALVYSAVSKGKKP